ATNQPTILAAGERLPLRPQSLGFVYLATTLEFIQNPREVLLEAHTALRPGGTLATLTINPLSSWGRLYLERARSGDILFQHATLLTLETVKTLHQEAGFQPRDAFGTLASHPWDPQVRGGRHPPDERCGVLIVHSTKPHRGEGGSPIPADPRHPQRKEHVKRRKKPVINVKKPGGLEA
ncbi:MAG: class I SAM-dependent methyltransferase, partial [Promethearchaeota archaeon]